MGAAKGALRQGATPAIGWIRTSPSNVGKLMNKVLHCITKVTSENSCFRGPWNLTYSSSSKGVLRSFGEGSAAPGLSPNGVVDPLFHTIVVAPCNSSFWESGCKHYIR